MKKKLYLWEDRQPGSGNMSVDLHAGKPTSAFKPLSSSRAENSDPLEQTPTTPHTWTHSLPFTQTVMVSPLSRTEGRRSRALPPDGGDREAKLQRLAGLEKEVQRLRDLLGLEITKTTQGTMTSDDSCPENQKQGPVRPSASRAIGCQTDMAEVSKVHFNDDNLSSLNC